MTARPLVYVLVLNYSSFEDTIQCVETLRRLDHSNVRLLVIDNASPDGSGKALSQRFGEAEFLQLPMNTGYAGGNNAGIRVALERGADYVFVVNPDIRVDESTVSHCVELMQRDRTMMSRETLEQVGGFDPLFFAYGEEEDLARRIRLKGLRLVVTSAAVVRHLRTKEGRASDYVLFLRMKGAHLYTLKDPSAAFRQSLGRVLTDMARDLRRQRADQYPFKQFPVTRWHVLRAISWIALHLPQIYRHRSLERGAPYLS